MPYSIKEAAEATGRTKPTILRAIQKGRISATKDDNGEWLIEPAELHRVYAPVPDGTDTDTDADGADSATVRLYERLLAEKDETIADLRSRLDAEAEERRRLTLMLTDQRPRRRWWHWRRG